MTLTGHLKELRNRLIICAVVFVVGVVVSLAYADRLIDLLTACLLYTSAKSMLCGEKSFALKKVLTNINMIAILAGAALFLLHLQLPAVIEDSLDMVGSAIGPISMIILGMLMEGMHFTKIDVYKRQENNLSTSAMNKMPASKIVNPSSSSNS